MPNLIYEIGTEELPALAIPPALKMLEKGFKSAAKAARLEHGKVSVLATPRRLALMVDKVAERQTDLVEILKGPAVRIAYDKDGNPTRAAMGFARGKGIDVSELITVSTDKGDYIGVNKSIKGKAASLVLPNLLVSLTKNIPWKKAMRWGSEPQAFGRPVHWILALLDDQVLNFSFAGIKAGQKSFGHRVHANYPIPIATAADYLGAMEKAAIMVDQDQRRECILREIRQLAAKEGGHVIELPALVDEVIHLAERPECMIGRFDPKFLALPKEVLISSMVEHQRYFPVEQDDRLLPVFVMVNNTAANDPEVVRRGNERVLHARLSDGRFFFEEDQKRPLHARVEQLGSIIYFKTLGTLYDKVGRLETHAGWLAEQLKGDIPEVIHTVRRAARLCKADLLTGMVGEFPDLQGLMGSEYALADGEGVEVATAIWEHYLPAGVSDSVPETAAGAVLSMADKMDAIVGFFGIGKKPTGTADPYALRRAALGIIRIFLHHNWIGDLELWVRKVYTTFQSGVLTVPEDKTVKEVMHFIAGRLRVFLAQANDSDVIDAVLSISSGDILGAVEKIRIFNRLKGTLEFNPFVVAFKRVFNILKKGAPEGILQPEALNEPMEIALHKEFLKVSGRVEDALADRNFPMAIETLASLRPVLDNFFDSVFVMDPDPDIRRNRLCLLMELKKLFLDVADVSKIQVAVQSTE